MQKSAKSKGCVVAQIAGMVAVLVSVVSMEGSVAMVQMQYLAGMEGKTTYQPAEKTEVGKIRALISVLAKMEQTSTIGIHHYEKNSKALMYHDTKGGIRTIHATRAAILTHKLVDLTDKSFANTTGTYFEVAKSCVKGFYNQNLIFTQTHYRITIPQDALAASVMLDEAAITTTMGHLLGPNGEYIKYLYIFTTSQGRVTTVFISDH
jgi:hypothetical protein